jgi:hypothetical protein
MFLIFAFCLLIESTQKAKSPKVSKVFFVEHLEYKISKVITLDVGHFWLPSTTFILSRARSNLV